MCKYFRCCFCSLRSKKRSPKLEEYTLFLHFTHDEVERECVVDLEATKWLKKVLTSGEGPMIQLANLYNASEGCSAVDTLQQARVLDRCVQMLSITHSLRISVGLRLVSNACIRNPMISSCSREIDGCNEMNRLTKSILTKSSQTPTALRSEESDASEESAFGEAMRTVEERAVAEATRYVEEWAVGEATRAVEEKKSDEPTLQADKRNVGEGSNAAQQSLAGEERVVCEVGMNAGV